MGCGWLPLKSHPTNFMSIELRTTTDVNVAVLAYINTCLKNDQACFEQTKKFLSQKADRTAMLNNDRGVSKGEEFKLTVQMPDILGCYVIRQFPEIFETKKSLYSFMRAFPQFTAPVDPDKTKYINVTTPVQETV